MTSYWGNANGLFVASVILACFLFGGRVFLYCRRNTRPMAEMPLDGQFFARVFMFIFSSWTKVMFWYIFVMCLYWFLFYKVGCTASSNFYVRFGEFRYFGKKSRCCNFNLTPISTPFPNP